MSIIQESSVGIPVGLTRGEKVLRYAFLALMIGAIAYSIGGTFVGRDNRLTDYGLAAATLLLASQKPGYSRKIPGVHPFLRACEWAVMPSNVAMGTTLVALCLSAILFAAKERARRRGLVPPAR